MATHFQMALRLRGLVEEILRSGQYPRDLVYSALEALYDQYEEGDMFDERNAVADVMDCFDGWSPLAARL